MGGEKIFLFLRIHFGEKLGSGLQRMKDFCDAENAPYPDIKFTDTHFYITFRQSKGYLEMAQEEKAKEALTVVLTERQKRAIEFVQEKGRITNKDYQELNKVHRNTATKDLESLVKLRILKRTGYGRGSSYEMV